AVTVASRATRASASLARASALIRRRHVVMIVVLAMIVVTVLVRRDGPHSALELLDAPPGPVLDERAASSEPTSTPSEDDDHHHDRGRHRVEAHHVHGGASAGRKGGKR